MLVLFSFHKYNMGQMHYLIWNKSNITSYSILFLLLSFLSFSRYLFHFTSSDCLQSFHSSFMCECDLFLRLCLSVCVCGVNINTHAFVFIWWNDTIGLLTLWPDPGIYFPPKEHILTHFAQFFFFYAFHPLIWICVFYDFTRSCLLKMIRSPVCSHRPATISFIKTNFSSWQFIEGSINSRLKIEKHTARAEIARAATGTVAIGRHSANHRPFIRLKVSTEGKNRLRIRKC